MKWLISLIFSVLLLGCWATSNFAYYAPLQDVTAWVEGTTVHYKVYDPKLGQWEEGSWVPDNPSFTSISGLKVQEGIVAWQVNSSWSLLALYDPGRNSWRGTWENETLTIEGATEIKDGIAIVKGNSVDPTQVVIYDAANGYWAYFRGGFGEIMQVGYGIVVGQTTKPAPDIFTISFGIYDPKAHKWVIGGYPTFNHLDVINIDANGTVTWTDNGVNYQRGYNPDTQQWYNGPFLPLASFAALPAAANGEFWFTDMSIGGTAWHYDFGDGTSSTSRSGLHNYSQPGVYTVTQTVTGATGNVTTTRTVTVEQQAPTGTLSINGGQVYTNSVGVTLGLSASPDTAWMRFSDDGTTWPDTWSAFQTTQSYNLPPGDGTKTVYTQLRDQVGNISDTVSAAIILDTTAPSPCNVSINAGAAYTNNPAVSLAFLAQDGGSGVSQMRLSNTPGDPASWTSWQTYATSLSPWNLLAGDGSKQVGVQFKDAAGNVGSAQATIVLDTAAPPTCAVAINADAVYTNSPNVTLALSAQDPGSGIVQMRLRHYDLTQEAPWSDFMAYASSKPFTLFSGNGRKWVEAQFKDGAGNISNTFSDTIILDATPPLNGSLSATPKNMQVTLEWSGFTDAASGIRTYMLYCRTVPFSDGAGGTKIYDGPGLTFLHTGLKKETTYYYRLCAQDNAGNISSGASATAKTQSGPVKFPFLMLLLGD